MWPWLATTQLSVIDTRACVTNTQLALSHTPTHPHTHTHTHIEYLQPISPRAPLLQALYLFCCLSVAHCLASGTISFPTLELRFYMRDVSTTSDCSLKELLDIHVRSNYLRMAPWDNILVGQSRCIVGQSRCIVGELWVPEETPSLAPQTCSNIAPHWPTGPLHYSLKWRTSRWSMAIFLSASPALVGSQLYLYLLS